MDTGFRITNCAGESLAPPISEQLEHVLSDEPMSPGLLAATAWMLYDVVFSAETAEDELVKLEARGLARRDDSLGEGGWVKP